MGVVAVILGTAGMTVGLREFGLWRLLRRIRSTTPERLVAAAREGRLDGRVVAVAGLATTGAEGPLTSAVNDEPCVWHRHIVHKRQMSLHTTDRGTVQRSSRRRRVADKASEEPFDLAGTTSARVEVRPSGIRVDRPTARGTRILPGLVTEPFPAAEAMMGQVQQLFWHREWILRAGTPLFVIGEVHGSGSRISLRKPARGPHIVTTLTPSRLRWRTAARAALGVVVGPLAVVAGGTLLLVHYLT